MKTKFKRAYQRLDIKAYKGIVEDTMVLFFDTYDGEFVTTLSPDTIFTIEKHYHNHIFMWNIKADGELLETKDTKREAVQFLKQLKKKYKNRFPN